MQSRPWPRWTTPIAVLLVALWANKLVASIGSGIGWNMLWLCHVGALGLALAAALRWRWLVGITALWVLTGLPVWLIDALVLRQAPLASVLSHVAAFVAALYFVRAVGIGKRDWLWATLGFVLIQLLCRFITPPPLNVNLAHAVYSGWERVFANYWLYNLVTSAGLALSFLALQWLLQRGQDQPLSLRKA